MRLILVTLTIVLSTCLGLAFQPVSLNSKQILGSFVEDFELKSKDRARLHGVYYYNARGEKELLVNLVESHILSVDSEKLVLIARDVDDDGLVDTWFYQLESGDVWSLHKPIRNDQDFENIKNVLDLIFDGTGRWMVSLAAQYVFENLTLTGGDENQFWAQYEKRQMDLIDVAIRLESLAKQYPNDSTLLNFKKMNAEAWAELFSDFNKHNGTERFTMIGSDVAVFLLGGTIIKGISWVGKTTMNKFGLHRLVTAVNKMGEAHYLRLKSRMTDSRHAIKSQFPIRIKLAKDGFFGSILTRIWGARVYERPELIIEDLSMRNRMSNLVKKNLGFFAEGLKEIYKEKGYIMFSAGVQLTTEVVSRKYFSISDVPLILDEPLKKTEDIVNKIGSDKALVQNISYLTTETALVSGVTKILKLEGVPLVKRFIVCGFVSAINSVIMAKVVKDEVNPARMAGDTAWEVLVGNSQVFFDLWQWQKWKDLGKTVGNKQLKLVGVLITFVHQSAGYYYYNKWSELLEEGTLSEDESVPLSPMEFEGGKIMTAESNPVVNKPEWQQVLVPVYAP